MQYSPENFFSGILQPVYGFGNGSRIHASHCSAGAQAVCIGVVNAGVPNDVLFVVGVARRQINPVIFQICSSEQILDLLPQLAYFPPQLRNGRFQLRNPLFVRRAIR